MRHLPWSERLELLSVKGAGGCWLWPGAQNEDGYCRLTIKRKRFMAHRFSYSIFRGEIPGGMLVLHKCDIRHCINPEHLFLGTDRDNVYDCISKGRRAPILRGEASPSARLLKSQVDQVRKSSKNGRSINEMAVIMGVSRSLIRQILQGKIWT